MTSSESPQWPRPGGPGAESSHRGAVTPMEQTQMDRWPRGPAGASAQALGVRRTLSARLSGRSMRGRREQQPRAGGVGDGQTGHTQGIQGTGLRAPGG